MDFSAYNSLSGTIITEVRDRNVIKETNALHSVRICSRLYYIHAVRFFEGVIRLWDSCVLVSLRRLFITTIVIILRILRIIVIIIRTRLCALAIGVRK